jgi:hypothetical protein
MRVSAVSVLLFLAAGLASSPAVPKKPAVETITYTPGCGLFHCRNYTVTVSSDGTVWFTGRKNTAVGGKHRFRVTKAAFVAFRQRLAPYRPTKELRLDEAPQCGAMATDQDSVDIGWVGGGSPAHLSVYYGCDMDKNDKMFDAIRTAPKLLPLARFVGWR